MVKTCLGKLHSLCYFMISDYIYIHIYIKYIYIYIYIYIKLYNYIILYIYNYIKLLEPLQGDSLLFTRNSWYSLDQYRKDERLRWPWSHSVVLNLCMNLVITKNKFESQFKLTHLWPLTVNCLKVSSQSYLAGLSKICFLCTYVDQMIIQ